MQFGCTVITSCQVGVRRASQTSPIFVGYIRHDYLTSIQTLLFVVQKPLLEEWIEE